jgi:hypothetical protein
MAPATGKAAGMEKVTDNGLGQEAAAERAVEVEVDRVAVVEVGEGEERVAERVTGAVVAVMMVTMAAVVRRRRLRAMAGDSLRRPTMVGSQGKNGTKLSRWQRRERL